MFTWNIAKSAEAMFSRWAIKRLCKFLLKKKLGKFILGDIDLNQLDVQLIAGTIQLSDLALNVDYVNHKLGAAASIIVKEGSIGSLLVTMPWKGDGCQVEVDELELVLGPGGKDVSEDASEPCSSSRDGGDDIMTNSRNPQQRSTNNSFGNVSSIDVHEGVKTIAKMVKLLLSSFQMKIKKLIVAFDPFLGEEKENGFCKTLVLRISELESGTCLTEDASPSGNASNNILGISLLTNSVKFHGAVLEFVQMDGVVNEKPHMCGSGSTLSEWSGCCPSNATTPIIAGENGGFSGNLKLSIPWINGSLDMRKVHADAYVDPLELRFQPSTITCIINIWAIFEDMEKKRKGRTVSKEADSVFHNAASSFQSSNASCVFATNKPQAVNCSSFMEKELSSEALLSESHLISDWVSRSNEDKTDEEPDFGASVEHFFECIDGLRNSQSMIGNSGMWNWTCSVFSAITAASNLASGSSYVPYVQQHVETSFKTTFSRISLIISFTDKDPCAMIANQAEAKSPVHYVDANFHSLVLLLQISPRVINLEGSAQHVELADHFSSEHSVMATKLVHRNDYIGSQAVSFGALQDAVENSLPPFLVDMDGCATDVSINMHLQDRYTSINRDIYREDVIKVTLFRTLGMTRCHARIESDSSQNVFMGPTCFSAKLPPFILWVNFSLISTVLDLLKEIAGAAGMLSRSNEFVASQGDDGISCHPHVTSVSAKESVKGDIFLPNARIVLCFPPKKSGNIESYSLGDQFIALDLSSPLPAVEKRPQFSEATPPLSSYKKYSSAISRSVHLNLGQLSVHVISQASGENMQHEFHSMQRLSFYSQKIISITGCNSVISMFWQEGLVTGPWIAKKAKLLASSENVRSRDKSKGDGYEFASASTVKDMEDSDAHTRDEMVLSSGFSLHAHLSPVTIDASKSLYERFCFLLDQLTDSLSSLSSDTVDSKGLSSMSQTSILVECESVAITVSMEAGEDAKGSIQNELSGSWHRFRLKIRNFKLLSVSNVGGIRGVNFLWLAHGEGTLNGFVTGIPEKELLLISCCNSTMGRGDGEGSNILSSRFAGSDIICFSDPESFHNSTSITVRCSTIIALGGRLDWLEAISSFFTLSSPDIEKTGDNRLPKADAAKTVPCESSFILSLIDVGISYEPYSNNMVVHEGLGSESRSGDGDEIINEQRVACLLVASSLRLSNKTLGDSIEGEYKIRLHDIGLLLCDSGLKLVAYPYSVEHLNKVGYVKVAQEAHIEALLRTNCKIGHLWELECSESHIILNTCHDTASGLFRLVSQLQQLFVPDVEESVIHLQSRWNNIQEAHESLEKRAGGQHVSSASQLGGPSAETSSKPNVGSLMDEICEDAFQLDADGDGQAGLFESHIHVSSYNDFLQESCSSVGPECYSGCSPSRGSSRDMESDNSGFPELIEEYFLSDLRPLSEISLKSQPSNDIMKCKEGTSRSGDVQNSGWYGEGSLKILENHVSDINGLASVRPLVECEASSIHTEPDDCGKVKGRINLKNLNVVWRMYAGSDWHEPRRTVLRSAVYSGRDTATCLEVTLSGMEFQYDVFPDGGVHASKLFVSIQDFALNDCSKDAPWKMVLGYYQSKDHPREHSSKALKLDLQAVRPDPSVPLEEYRLRVAILPIRLHLHQSQLDFLISFFGGKSSSVSRSQDAPQETSEPGMLQKNTTRVGGHTIIEEALLPYFQKFDIWPVVIRVDYSPCHVDLAALRGGKYVELVNVVPWKGVELQLKHVQAVGVYGWSCVCETILGEWLEDISQNQIHKLLRGLAPIRSLVAVGSGAAKLVSLPVKSYRKDHRLLKGMQRGTIAFLRSISLEAIGLGVHLAAGAHDILLQAEYILTSIPPSVPWPLQSGASSNVRSNQPMDARQGIHQAYESISDGFGKSASALVRTPLKKYQRSGSVGSALATAVQAAPAAAVAPASAAARAVHCALLGVRNSLDREHKKESLDKYLGPTHSREFM